MINFCFSGNVFSPIGRFVSSIPNLLAHQAVKQMEGVSELLPEEDVQKLKSVPKRLPLHEGEIVRELKEFGVGAYGYDPLLSDEMIEGVGVKVSDDQDAKVDCVIVTVAHDEFRELGQFMAMGETPVLVDDVRWMFDGEETEMRGFYYRRL